MRGEYTAPSTPTEEVLSGLWSQVFGLDCVSVHDDFFELGGHSLLGMQLLARVRRTFEVELPVRRLFEEPTIAGLALEIEKAAANGTGIQARTITRRPRITADALPTELENLSPDQITALLERILREKQN